MIIITAILVILMLVVFWLDMTRFIIPNWLVGAVIGLYPLYVMINPIEVDWLSSLGVCLAAFAVGIAIFAANIMGGGDVKLLTGCCLWVGTSSIAEYIIFTSMLGAILALLLLTSRPMIGYLWLIAFENRPIPKLFSRGQPIPYGLAIAGALLILIAQGKIIGLFT